MVGKVALLFCAQALLAQYITSQCLGPAYNGLGLDAAWGAGVPWNGLPYGVEAPLAASWGAPCGAADLIVPAFAPTNGGGFLIKSASPIAVTGVSMTSENIYEGPLAVSGAMPFLGAVALEGALPTVGAGAVTYGCGNGNVAMLSEDIATGFNGYGLPYGPGIAAAELGYGYGAPLGLEAGIAGPYGFGYNRGCGCGALY